MHDFSNYLSKSKYYDSSSKLVIGKVKVETTCVVIKLWLSRNSKHKNVNGVNKKVVAAISHKEYKDALWNNKCIRHSINSIQSKNHRIGTYEMIKTSLSCFNDKIYIQNNGYDRLALGYQS